MSEIKITVTGLPEALAELDAIKARMRDLRPVLDASGQAAIEYLEAQVFGQSRAPDGSAWEPLDDGGAATLGPVGDSLAAQTTEQSLSVFPELDWAGVHQFGSEDLPARPFMPEGEDEVGTLAGDVAARVERYVATGDL